MKDQKFTKGPWTYKKDYDKKYKQAIVNINSTGIEGMATVWTGRHQVSESDLANAKVMSAAPELLYACMEFVRKVDAGEARSIRSYNQMKLAIKKALGE